MLAVVAYSSVLHRTKSSANIAHFTGDGHFLVRLLMNTRKSVGDMTPPCGTPCLRSIFLLFVLSMTTLARRLYRYDLIYRNIFQEMLHFFIIILIIIKYIYIAQYPTNTACSTRL